MKAVVVCLRQLSGFENIIAATAYGLLSVAVLADVFAREVMAVPVVGLQRFAVYMTIIAGFLGVSLATTAGSHIRPRIADNWVSAAWEPLINRASSLVTSLTFGVTGYFACLFWYTNFTMGEVAPVLDWPLWPILIVIPYAFFSSALRYLLYAIYPELNPTGAEETEVR